MIAREPHPRRALSQRRPSIAVGTSAALAVLAWLVPLGVTQAQEASRADAARRAAIRDSAARDSLNGLRSPALRAVQVTVTRDQARSPFDLPFAVSSVGLDARPAPRRAGIGDLLLAVPGVQVQDRANPSQDPRLTIRGFGARSAFGVRGVRVVRDGVPVSLPDGQTPLDWLDLETVQRVDVVRGTAAALYGNAAGGVVDLRSVEPTAKAFDWRSRVWDGGGLQRAHLEASGTVPSAVAGIGQPWWLAALTRTRGNGPRTWSRLDATNAFARMGTTVHGTRVEMQGTRYDAPRAENPGALTADELARDVRLPDSLNITKDSRKAVMQSQLAVLAERAVGQGTVRASVFGGARTLDNPLPFAVVAVDRHVVGGGIHGAWRVTRWPWPVRFGVGADAQRQHDERYNFENCADVAVTTPVTTRCPTAGNERGAVRLNQREMATGAGAYARVEAEAPHGLFVSAALRGDQVHFGLTDRFITSTNPDDSGDRTLHAVSPMAGLTWRLRPTWSWYVNVSSAFETPTITELTNQPDGSGGLNQSLEPQRTRTVEVGTRAFAGSHLRVDVAAFKARVLDELVGFDVPGQAGRRAFRNAGQTSRTGAEVGLRGEWAGVSAGAAYTWAHYRFDRYDVGTVSYAGKPIPGIPDAYGQAFVTLRHAALWMTTEVTASSRASATDGATVYGAGYAVWNWRVGSTMPLGYVRLDPTVNIENLFDRHYASSLVLNANRNRYFEPGLARRVSLAISLARR